MAGSACYPADAGIGSYEAKAVDAAGNAVATGNGEVTPAGIAVTAGEVPVFSSRYLGAVRLILSNATPDFIRIDSVSLSFGEALDKHVSIPAGEDIAGWGRAMAPRVWYWDGRSQVRRAYRPAHDILADIERFQQSRLSGGAPNTAAFPSEHLLAGPFSIPPGLSTIKWLLIKSDANAGACLERMLVTLHPAQREPQRLLVQFRDKALTQSEWQKNECAAAAPKSSWGV
jgi:hypothetical protein